MMVNNDGYYMVNIWLMMVNDISGWWYTYPSEKYESQWEGWHPIYEMEEHKQINKS